MYKKYSINIPIYEVKINLYFTDNIGYVYNNILKFEEDKDTSQALSGTHNAALFIIFTYEYLDINTITHETFHILSEIMNSRDVKYDHYNDEPWAYLNGYINEKIFEICKKEKNNL